MRLLIFLAIAVAKLYADQSAIDLCDRFKGTWKLASENTQPHQCTDLQLPIVSNTPAAAKLACSYLIPFKTYNTKHGQITKCSFDVFMVCPPDWKQIHGKCYKMVVALSKTDADAACANENLVDVKGAKLADVMSTSLPRMISLVFTPILSDVWINSFTNQLKSFHAPSIQKGSSKKYQLVWNNAFRYGVRPGSIVEVDENRPGQALCAYKPPNTPRMTFESYKWLEKLARVYNDNGRIYMIPFNHYHLDDANKNPTGKNLHAVCKKLSPFFDINTAHAAYPVKEETSGLKNTLAHHKITYAIIPAGSHADIPVRSECSTQDQTAIGRFRKTFGVELPDGKQGKIDDNAWVNQKPGGECSRIPRKAAIMHQTGVYDVPNIYRGNVVCAMKGDVVDPQQLSPPCSKHASYNPTTGECTCKPNTKDYVDLGKYTGPRGFFCETCDSRTVYGIVVMVVDHSGSMWNFYHQRVIPFVKGAYSAFKGSPMGLVWFGSYVTVGSEIKTFGNKNEWEGLITHPCGGLTDTGGAMDEAREMIERYTRTHPEVKRKSIILVTDGEPTLRTDESVRQSFRDAERKGISIWQIFIGQGATWSSGTYQKMRKFQCDGSKTLNCESHMRYATTSALDSNAMASFMEKFCVADDTV